MSKTVLDSLRYVLQNMRLQEGQMAKVQADIVAQAIVEIETLDNHIEQMNRNYGVARCNEALFSETR